MSRCRFKSSCWLHPCSFYQCFFLSVCPSRQCLTQPRYCESTQGHESSVLNTARVKVHEKICVLSVRGHTHRHTHMFLCCCNAYGAYFKVYLTNTTTSKEINIQAGCTVQVLHSTSHTNNKLTCFKITAGVVQPCIQLILRSLHGVSQGTAVTHKANIM